jgi:patched 1 protein
VAFNLVSMVLLFPTFLSLDLRRVAAGKVDLLCCYKARKSSRPKDSAIATMTQPQTSEGLKNVESYPKSLSSSRDLIEEKETGRSDGESQFTKVCAQWSLTWFAGRYYGYWITRAPVKVLTIVFCVAMTGAGIYGLTKVTDGLDLTDVVPRDTSVYRFLKAQDDYFGFYNMYAVTQSNFEYPQNQKILYDYHNAFVRVPTIVKDDDGGIPEFWLSLFRNWLAGLQTAFDDDMASGNLHEKGWHANASAEAILAYKLMVQTGHVDYPVDKTLLNRNRLVDSHGVINPSAFYNYLSAWATNDGMAYSYSQASLVPTPKEWFHDVRDTDLKVPKSQPIVLARIPFYLNNLGDTEVTVDTIRRVRQICEKFEERGLPNFPSGIPFTFWEQYLSLRFWLAVGLVCILAAVFFVVSFVLMSPWIAAVVVVVIATIVVQLFGAMGLLGIKLSAVPAIILIVSVGIGVEFTVHICIVSLTSFPEILQFKTFLSLSLFSFSNFR